LVMELLVMELLVMELLVMELGSPRGCQLRRICRPRVSAEAGETAGQRRTCAVFGSSVSLSMG